MTRPDSEEHTAIDATITGELRDTTIRIIFIPFFGLVIPNLTGMIDNSRYTPLELAAAYLYFTFIAFAIWHGNRYLLFRLRLRYSWLRQPVYKIVALVVSNVFYTIPVAVGLMTLWYAFTGHAAMDWNVVFKATALCVICVVFITHTYETVFLIKSWGTDKDRSERLDRARIQAELEALKNQIDPHFMFNSLNTLSHLIEQSPGRAKQFNDRLAEVYRYILSNRNRNLVLLTEELAFGEAYFALLRIRFGSAVRYHVPAGLAADNLLIPPISLQFLLENAIKHNDFSEAHPLEISLTVNEDFLVVTNDIRPKQMAAPSAHVGLLNLNERYRLVTGKAINIHETQGTFAVSLPLLKVT